MTKTTVYINSSAVRLAADRSRCPGCNASLTGATGLSIGTRPSETPMPSPGDLTVCGYCGEILEFRFDYSLGSLPPERLADCSKQQRKLLTMVSQQVKQRPMPGPRE